MQVAAMTTATTPTGRDLSGEVAKYRDLVESLAARLVRPGRMTRNGVEYDDLVQEGLIFVWQSLQNGAAPSADMTRKTMLAYARKMGAQKRGGTTEFVPYEEEYHDDEDEGG